MAATNPFRQIREALQGASYLGGIADLPANNVKGYDGEAEGGREKSWELLKQMVARAGNYCLIRPFRTQQMPDSPPSMDAQDVDVQLIVAVASVRSRAAAGEAGEQLAWDCYAAVKQTTTGLTWLLENWELAGMVNEHQAANFAVWSVLIRTRAHFATWTE